MAQHDHRFSQFLEQQHEEGMALAAASDRVDLRPLGTASIRAASINAESTNTAPINTYLAHFNCTGLVRQNGQVFEHNDYVVGICFPDAYLSHFDTARVLSWCAPNEIWHPNIRMPFACVKEFTVFTITHAHNLAHFANLTSTFFNFFASSSVI